MAKKRGCLGCSFPVLIGIVVIVVALFVIGFAAGPLGKSILPRFGLEVNLPHWLSAARPEPELPAETIFHIGPIPITNTIISAWLTVAVLIISSFLITRKMKLVPGGMQNAFEFLLGALYSFCETVAGEKHGRQFFPAVATLFLFVMFNAYLGLLPFFGSVTIHTAEGEAHLFRPANTDINVPLALALASFVFVEYFGLKEHGFRYLGKFFNFAPFLGSLSKMVTRKMKFSVLSLLTDAISIGVGFLELLSELIRIISFTFRLFGNMTAGEILLLVVTFLVPWLVALPFYGLELLVGFVQALIFGGLTLVFLTMAVVAHGEESHESH